MSRFLPGLIAALLVLWSPAVLACANGMEGDRISVWVGGMLAAAIGGFLMFCLAVGGLVFFLVRRRQQVQAG